MWDRHLFIKPDENNELRIFGFLQKPCDEWDSINHRRGGGSHTPAFISIEIHGPGEIRVNYPIYCEYNKGEINIFSDLYSIESIDKWLIDVALQIDTWQENPTYNSKNLPKTSEGMTGSHFFQPTLSNILKYMREEKHGGCIAIVPSNRELWEKAIEINNYEINSKYLIESMENRFKYNSILQYLYCEYYNPKDRARMFEKGKEVVDIATSIDKLHFSERNLEKAEKFIASLSYVDGAVVLDRRLSLIGFGARFIAKRDGESTFKNVGGTRHKSAYDFCRKVKESIAIVVSQDGGITVFSNNGENSCKDEKVILNYHRTDT